MTDKKPIIDGVDVSGCEFYATNKKARLLEQCDCSRHKICPTNSVYKLAAECCNGYECYYKQLAHKTEECEKLKSLLGEIKEKLLKHTDIPDLECMYKTEPCKYPECRDEFTENGKTCLARATEEIVSKIEETLE